MEEPKETPLERHQRVVEEAEETDFVLSRVRLRGLGIDRHQTKRQITAGRWVRHGNQTISVRDAPLSHLAQCWRAVWEVGDEITLVDGVTALQLAGLKGWTDDVIHVSIVHRHDPTHLPGVKVHKVIGRVEGEVTAAGIPRTSPAVAAIRAAHWAVSDRQAATILAMVVQQRLVTGDQLLAAGRRVRGRTRRAFIPRIVRDIANGAHSLNELDFASSCRARGMPEPTRQAVRKGKDGRIYLDVYFEEYRLVIEIDGAGHLWGLNGVADALRANQVVIDGDRVLRINILGWRLDPEAFLDQVEAALASEWAQTNLARSRSLRALPVPADPVPSPVEVSPSA